MKFIYLIGTLLAATVSGAPTASEPDYAIDYASGNVTGEAIPVLAEDLEHLTGRGLVKRANVVFQVFPSSDCFGVFTQITADGTGTKGNFNPAQHSVRILSLTNGWHLTLYTGLSQSGVLTRFRATEVGADKCYVGSWLSYGLFSS